MYKCHPAEASAGQMKKFVCQEAWNSMSLHRKVSNGWIEESSIDQLLFRPDAVSVDAIGVFLRADVGAAGLYSGMASQIQNTTALLLSHIGDSVQRIYTDRSATSDLSEAHIVSNTCLSMIELPDLTKPDLQREDTINAAIVAATTRLTGDFIAAAYVTGATFMPERYMVIQSQAQPRRTFFVAICKLFNAGYPPTLSECPPPYLSWYHNLCPLAAWAAYTTSCRMSMWLAMADAADTRAYDYYIMGGELKRYDMSRERAFLLHCVFPYPPHTVDDARTALYMWKSLREATFLGDDGFGLLPDPTLHEFDPMPRRPVHVTGKRVRDESWQLDGIDDGEEDVDMDTGAVGIGVVREWGGLGSEGTTTVMTNAELVPNPGPLKKNRIASSAPVHLDPASAVSAEEAAAVADRHRLYLVEVEKENQQDASSFRDAIRAMGWTMEV